MEKEFNPSLQFDAFTAGIEDGGLRSSSSITIVVCYILAHCNRKITQRNIIDALVDGKIANYFEISSAIGKLLKKGYIKETSDGYLEINGDCKFLIEMVENDLPLTIRERSVELVTKFATMEVNKKENKVTIEKENDTYKITMHVSDIASDFMELSLYLKSRQQAEVVKEKFQQHPADVYKNLMNSIFDVE